MVANKSSEGAESLMISVRVRPLKSEESAKGWVRSVDAIDDKMIILQEKSSDKLDVLRANRVKDKKFVYDVSFGEKSTQDQVYMKTTRPLIDKVVTGFNVTIFAYGPTGAGKTYTMVGTQENPGIMVRALNDLFRITKQGEEKFDVSMSYLEIYNENIRDLLEYTGQTLELQENPRTGVIKVAGLSWITAKSTDQVMRLLEYGNKQRISESTAANKTSSRSHALLQVNVNSSTHAKSHNKEVRNGRLCMVDLAGSERARMTQNIGKRFQEGAAINKALLALGNVINALAEGRAKYVNYRDSKLTRLLKESLSGNCKTVMIAHVSPADAHREETRNTLNYADRAKSISNKVRKNIVDVSYHISQYQSIIQELKEEIGRLKEKMGNNIDEPRLDKSVPVRAHETSQLKQQLVKNFEEQMNVRKKLASVEQTMIALEREVDKQETMLKNWKKEKAAKDVNREALCSDNETDEDDDTPDEIKHAPEYIAYLNMEQTRCKEMKENIESEIIELKRKSAEIEETLPSKASFREQKELLVLLCKVHELEITKMEMESAALIKDNEIYQKDQQILRYENQRHICDQIITKQRDMIEGFQKKTDNETRPSTMCNSDSSSSELKKLYLIYNAENEPISDRNSNFGNPEKLPPISPTTRDSEILFTKALRRASLKTVPRSPTALSIRSHNSSPRSSPKITNINKTSLPPIGRRHNQSNQNQKASPRLSYERSRSGSFPEHKKSERISPGQYSVSASRNNTLGRRVALHRKKELKKIPRTSSLDRVNKERGAKLSAKLRPPLHSRRRSHDDLFDVGQVMHI